jgi:hypothetical protein
VSLQSDILYSLNQTKEERKYYVDGILNLLDQVFATDTDTIYYPDDCQISEKDLSSPAY